MKAPQVHHNRAKARTNQVAANKQLFANRVDNRFSRPSTRACAHNMLGPWAHGGAGTTGCIALACHALAPAPSPCKPRTMQGSSLKLCLGWVHLSRCLKAQARTQLTWTRTPPALEATVILDISAAISLSSWRLPALLANAVDRSMLLP